MKKRRNPVESFIYDIIKVVFLWVLLVGFRTKYHYIDKSVQKRHIKKGALIVSNHSSWTDIFVIIFAFYFRHVKFLAKKELSGTTKLGALWMRIFGTIPIDRHALDIEAISECLDVLKRDELLTIFPEGTRIKGEEMGVLKSGVSLLALQARVPIVPVYILPRKKWYQRKQMIIGKPIEMTEDKEITVSVKNIELVTNEISSNISFLHDELQKRMKK